MLAKVSSRLASALSKLTWSVVAVILAAVAAACAGFDIDPHRGENTNFSTAPRDATTETITVDFAQPLDPLPTWFGRALSATPGRSRMNETTWARLRALDLEYVRLWLMFDKYYNFDTKVADLNNPTMNEYFAKYADISRKILVNIDYSRYYEVLVTTGRWSEADYISSYTDVLIDLKTKYPEIEFLEMGNEPDAHGMRVDRWYQYLRQFYGIVAVVNLKIANGEIPGPILKIGGPTTYKFDDTQLENWIRRTLEFFVNDGLADKRWDFVTYHQYLLREFPASQPADIFKRQPIRVATERAKIDQTLTSLGLPAGMPILITEGGMYAGDQPVPTPTGDYFIKAAGSLAMFYYYAPQADIIPFLWTVDSIDQVKTLFVLDAPKGKSTGDIRPFYNATLFQTQLPLNRVTSDVWLDADGRGLGTIASYGTDRAAVLLWNFQYDGTRSYDFSLSLKNLPAQILSQTLRLTVKAVRADLDRGDPIMEVDQYVLPFSDRELDLTLGPNEFVLVELVKVL